MNQKGRALNVADDAGIVCRVARERDHRRPFLCPSFDSKAGDRVQ
jgi:hypothetical protein